MTYAQSLVAFGSYTFPIGTMVKSRKLSSDIDETKMLGLDGTIAPPGKLQAQTLTLEIEIGGGGDIDPVRNAIINTIDDLDNAANDLFAALAAGYENLVLGLTPARYLTAQKKEYSIQYLEGSGRRHANMSVDFYAPDPRFKSVTTTTRTSGGSATNAGNAPTYPVVTYAQTGGAASGQVILQIIPTGATGHVKLTLGITLQDGDVLVIDCDPRNRANGIVYTPSGGDPVSGLYLLGTTGIENTLGDDSTFPFMLPGGNTVSFSGANSISFTWADAYWL